MPRFVIILNTQITAPAVMTRRRCFYLMKGNRRAILTRFIRPVDREKEMLLEVYAVQLEEEEFAQVIIE